MRRRSSVSVSPVRSRRASSIKSAGLAVGTVVGLRKISSTFSLSSSGSGRSLSSGPKKSSLVDGGVLEGKIKVSSTIDNPDLCLSVNYRADGRYYAAALANGVINVFSSKTDNIIYSLNKTDPDQPPSGVSATCVRFRPFQLQQLQADSLPQSLEGRRGSQRKSSLFSGGGGGGGGSTDSGSFLPPIAPQPACIAGLHHHPFSQRRRKSSVSALGVKLEELGLFSQGSEKSAPNNMVTASFTDGSLKTFNFITDQCLQEVKEDREILTIGYSKSGSSLATGGSDGCIHIYDDETKTKTCSYEPPFEYKAELLRTYSIAFHPDSESELISGGWNKYVQFYDVRVPNMLVGKVAGPKMCGEGLAFHPSGSEFCAAAWGKQEGLQIFDYSMRQPIESILGSEKLSGGSLSDSPKSLMVPSRKVLSKPPSCLYSASYFLDNWIVIGGSYPGGLTLVERRPGRNVIAGIHELEKSVYCVSTFKSKVAFVVDQEVCVSEIYL